MAASVVERLKRILTGEKLITPALSALITVLADQCKNKIQSMQEQHRSVSTKCVGLELAKVNVNEKQELLKSSVAKLDKKVTAAKNKVPLAQKRLDAAQANFDKVEHKVEDVEKEHEAAKEELTELKKRFLDTERLNSEYTNQKDSNNMERQLESVNGLNEESCSSSLSSSSSSSVGSKRGRSSSSSPPLHQHVDRNVKRIKMINHPGQWLFEEGYAYCCGNYFKKMDKQRGQLVAQASAAAGFPMTVADCHYMGWNGLDQDNKKAFDEFVKIEKDMNGHSS